jgi:hypothetical protein
VAIFFGIQAFFNLHLDWVVMQVDVENTFNNIFQIIILKKLCDVGGPLVSIVPFTKLFYGAHSYLITNLGNMWKRSQLLNHFQARSKVTP